MCVHERGCQPARLTSGTCRPQPQTAKAEPITCRPVSRSCQEPTQLIDQRNKLADNDENPEINACPKLATWNTGPTHQVDARAPVAPESPDAPSRKPAVAAAVGDFRCCVLGTECFQHVGNHAVCSIWKDEFATFGASALSRDLK